MTATPYELNTPADRPECLNCPHSNYDGVGECTIFHNTRIVRTAYGVCNVRIVRMKINDPHLIESRILDKAVEI